MSIFYSAATGGFYDTNIQVSLFIEQDGKLVPDPHGAIAGAVLVSADQHAALFAAQATGKIITADSNGNPIATDPPPPSSDHLAAIARSQRDALLSACDWTQCNDSPLSATTKASWATYREDLRNVPQQSAFPTTISWPAAP